MPAGRLYKRLSIAKEELQGSVHVRAAHEGETVGAISGKIQAIAYFYG
jgi:hypothetical protein